MAAKDETTEIKPAPGQSLEDALKIALRDRDEQLQTEREERKKANEEAAAHRKARRAAEEAAKEAEEKRARDGQKTLEEQGRFKDLYENERRGRETLQRERDELEKKLAEERQQVEQKTAKLSWHEKREIERIEARFARLPEEIRKLNADRPPEVKEAICDTLERTGGVRPQIAPALVPPSGLGPAGTVIREEDLEAMTHQERQKVYKSPEFDRAVREGRFIRKGQPGPR